MSSRAGRIRPWGTCDHSGRETNRRRGDRANGRGHVEVRVVSAKSTAGAERRVPEVAPIEHSIRVPVEPARAFKIFTAGVRDWWNQSYSASRTKSPIADVVLEPRVGGRWY